MIGPERRTMTRSQADTAQIDVGLRAHMLRVYNYMASGVALTAPFVMALGVGLSRRRRTTA